MGKFDDLMLVGEQGQVFPFQRFKNLAKVVVGGLILCLILAVVLGALLVRSQHRFSKLKNDLEGTRQQLAKLRDEKDLLLTQIVIKKKQNSAAQPLTDQNKPPKAARHQDTAAQVDTPEKTTAGRLPTKKARPPKPSETVAVKFGADARRLKVSYQAERSLLSLSFRVYNTSKPKAPLAGRTVVVFKNQDDPPIKWLVVPRMQLVDGKPDGKKGKAFKINNYRTEKFRAYGQKPPIRYNMATVYIFSSNGKLLLSKDHSFKIEAKPAPKPVIPAPKPVKEKPKLPAAPVKPEPPVVEPEPKEPTAQGDDAVTNTGNAPQPLPAPQAETPSSGAPSGAVVPSPEAPVTPVTPAMPTESDASQTQGEQIPQPTTQGE